MPARRPVPAAQVLEVTPDIHLPLIPEVQTIPTMEMVHTVLAEADTLTDEAFGASLARPSMTAKGISGNPASRTSTGRGTGESLAKVFSTVREYIASQGMVSSTDRSSD